MSNQSDDRLLFTITRRKSMAHGLGSLPDANFIKRSTLRQTLSLDRKDSESTTGSSTSENSLTFITATDDRGQKDYGTVKVSKAPLDLKRKETNQNKIRLLQSLEEEDVGSVSKNQIKSSEKKKRIAFSDTENKKSVVFDTSLSNTGGSMALSSESNNNTRYYLNYEGKLAVKRINLGKHTSQSELDYKIEAVISVLEEIISKLGSDGEISAWQNDSFLRKIESTSENTLKSTKYVSITDRMQTDKQGSKSGIQIDTSDQEHTVKFKTPQISSVVKSLGLPISVHKHQPFLDTKTKFEPLLLETDTHTDVLSTKVSEKESALEMKELTLADRSSRGSSNEVESSNESPFELNWCFGFNPEVPVVNLSNNDRFLVMFANSHYAALYNFHDNTMRFMQGHLNTVSCLATDSRGSLLVTADYGPNSRVIIWDSHPCVIAAINRVHRRGTQLVGLSHSGQYLVTVSPFPHQCLQLWLWRQDTSKPAASKYLNDSLGEIQKLTMNPTCEEEFAMTFETGITFVHFNGGKETGDKLQLNSTNQLISKLGTFTDTTFLSDEHAAALSSTTMGYVVMWVEENNNQQHTKIHEKHVRLHLNTITHIEAVDGLVALATENGNVSFLDPDLKIIYWSQKLQLGPLQSLSFNLSPHRPDEVCDHPSHGSCAVSWRKERSQLTDATLQNNPFSARHFVISTTDGRLAYINSTSDVPKSLLHPSSAVYTAMDVIPNSQYMCAGTAVGECLLFDVNDLQLKASQSLVVADNKCQAVSVLRYSSSGLQLACGMYTGEVWLLDPLFLTPRPHMPLSHCSDCVTHLTFSLEEDYLAVADTSQCVTLYCLDDAGRWQLGGQYQAHSKPVRDVFFVANNTNLKLFTMGCDRNIAEFDVFNKSLVFRHVHQVEQTAVPTCIVRYPASDHLLLMANSEMKFKLLDLQTLKYRKTFQAPNFNSTINFIELLPTETQHYLVFGTTHHIGLHILPIDGNTYKALGFIASPTAIVCCKIHPNGKYVFTISENCCAISMWKINTLAVEKFYTSGGENLEPFLSVLEGGQGGWREKDLREFFQVGQFIHQGDKPNIIRGITDSVAVCEVTNIFQALGFFPTKYQINNMLYEMTGEFKPSLKHCARQKIQFEDFVRLYVNHRPSCELSAADLYKAFRDFYAGVYYSDRDSSLLKFETDPVFDSTAFVEKLMVTGEMMPFSELYVALSILTDSKMEPPPDERRTLPQMSFMPKELSFATFARDLLGFDCMISGSTYF